MLRRHFQWNHISASFYPATFWRILLGRLPIQAEDSSSQRTSHRKRTPDNALFQPLIAGPVPRRRDAEDQADGCQSESMERGIGGSPGNDSTPGSSRRAKERECSKQEIAIGCRRIDQRFVPCPTGSYTRSRACESRFPRLHPATRLAQQSRLFSAAGRRDPPNLAGLELRPLPSTDQ